MPMGVVSDDEFDVELKRVDESLPVDKSNIIPITRGRGNTKEVTNEMRALIAGCAIKGEGTGAEIAKEFNVSRSSVSAYKGGATSTTDLGKRTDTELEAKNKKVKGRIIEKTTSRLEAAIEGITIEKIDQASLRTLSGLAKDMSSVIRSIEGDGDGGGVKTNINIYAPRMRQEDDYEVIEVEVN